MAGTATIVMPSSSRYLSLASSRLSSLKGKVTQYREDPNPSYMPSGVNRSLSNSQNWKQWAGQKIRRNLTKSEGKLVGYEEIVLFPGWAAKRYIDISGRPSGQGLSFPGATASRRLKLKTLRRPTEPFEVDVFVSGYATACRPPELVTRSQRAFLRLAKGVNGRSPRHLVARIYSPLSKGSLLCQSLCRMEIKRRRPLRDLQKTFLAVCHFLLAQLKCRRKTRPNCSSSSS